MLELNYSSLHTQGKEACLPSWPRGYSSLRELFTKEKVVVNGCILSGGDGGTTMIPSRCLDIPEIRSSET